MLIELHNKRIRYIEHGVESRSMRVRCIKFPLKPYFDGQWAGKPLKSDARQYKLKTCPKSSAVVVQFFITTPISLTWANEDQSKKKKRINENMFLLLEASLPILALPK